VGRLDGLSPESRLVQIVAAFRATRVECLVLGGHAVRFYGVSRNTIDYDLVVSLSAEDWARLGDIVGSLPFGRAPVEGPSWRPADFRRFTIGQLPDGRDERLEFWRKNHLLAPFADLSDRRCEGSYGGGTLAFLGLSDLLRSKETERESDWLDITLLEEIHDEHALRAGRIDDLRSRRGFERAAEAGLLTQPAALQAWSRAEHPVSLAYLQPYVGAASATPTTTGALAELLSGPLRAVDPGSARHLALVEAVRRLHKRQAMEADRADKRAASRRT